MTFSTSDPIIHRTGSHAVTYDLSQPHQTTITLPVNSQWSSELHWHETHDEFVRVLEGTIRVRLGPKIVLLRAGEEAKVPKFVRHEWTRAEVSEGGDVVVVERTEPADIQKHLFFWNLNGVILTSGITESGGRSAEMILTMRLFMIFHALDNWPVFWDLESYRDGLGEPLPSLLEWLISHAILATAAVLGSLFGYKVISKDFTPVLLLRSWEQGQVPHNKGE